MDFSKIKDSKNSNEITRAYIDSLLVESHYIDSCVADTTFELYGKKFASPIMIAAFSHLERITEDGMIKMAKGAAQANVCNFNGTGSKEELCEVLATGAETIKIIKPSADRSELIDRLKHSHESGALAVGIDIDHAFGSDGNPDVVREIVMSAITTEELKEYVKMTPLPLIVKGVLSVADALKCVEAGVSGIMISHHHGILKCGVPTLMVLPEIKKAVGDKLDIFVDCSIDNGFDAFKAIALGAKAVCVGRAIFPALKDGGTEGVVKYLEQMNNELRSMMSRTGSPNLSNISQGVIWNANTEQRII